MWCFLTPLLLSSSLLCDRWGSLQARDYPADSREGSLCCKSEGGRPAVAAVAAVAAAETHSIPA